MFAFGLCKARGPGSDPQTDTVKVSIGPKAGECDKENAGPSVPGTESTKLAEAEEERRSQEQEAEEDQHRQEALERTRAEQEEQQRREEEDQQRREEEQRQRAEEEERQRAEEEEERQRHLHEEERVRAEEERQRQQKKRHRAWKARKGESAPAYLSRIVRAIEERRQQKERQLGQFLSKHGFAGANEKKKTSGMLFSGFTYPLHAAVKAADAQAVGLLLWAGADRSLGDSKKRTPLAMAQKLDKNGSHKAVVDALLA